MKRCFRCGVEKDLAEFYEHPAMLDGHLNKCIPCAKRDVRRHRQGTTRPREYDRERKAGRPNTDARRIYQRAWRARDGHGPAHNAVARAIRTGRLVRLTCAECGSPKTHAHHNDYSRPLEVLWLCAIHHAAYEGRTILDPPEVSIARHE